MKNKFYGIFTIIFSLASIISIGAQPLFAADPEVCLSSNNPESKNIQPGAIDVPVLEVVIAVPEGSNFRLSQIIARKEGYVAAKVHDVKIRVRGPALDYTTNPKDLTHDGSAPFYFNLGMIPGERYFFTTLISTKVDAEPGATFSFWYVYPSDFEITDEKDGSPVDIRGDFPINGNQMTIAGMQSGSLKIAYDSSYENIVCPPGSNNVWLSPFDFAAGPEENIINEYLLVQPYGTREYFKNENIQFATRDYSVVLDAHLTQDGKIVFNDAFVVKKGQTLKLYPIVDVVQYAPKGAKISFEILEAEAIGEDSNKEVAIYGLPCRGGELEVYLPLSSTIGGRLELIRQIDAQIDALEEWIDELYELDPVPTDLILELELQILQLTMQKLELQLELEFLAPAFYGRVSDLNGNPLEAFIIIINKATKEKTVLVSENGYYEVTNLEPGLYLILALSPGFQADIEKEFLPEGEILNLNFQLISR